MTTTTEAQVVSVSEYYQAKIQFYQFLQLLFFEALTETTVEQLKNHGNLTELATMGQAGIYLNQFFDQITPKTLQKERDEFNRLFVGPGQILAPLWESVYLSKEHLLFDESTFQVRQQYHDFGLQYAKENNEPDDHLTVELEFMIFLNKRCLQGDEPKRLINRQIYFLEHHLCLWVPGFCELLMKHTESLLYKGAALLLLDFIQFDLQSLTEMKEALINVE